MTKTLKISLSALVAVLLGNAGCGPNARETLEQSFNQDAPVMVEYQMDGSMLYKTRNIVLHADFARSELTSLVVLFALPGTPATGNSVVPTDGLVKFRSISKTPNFEARRNLALNISTQEFDLGPCTYEQEVPAGGKAIENLSAIIPREILDAIARADNVRGVIGDVLFELAGEQLAPVRALIDTTQTLY